MLWILKAGDLSGEAPARHCGYFTAEGPCRSVTLTFGKPPVPRLGVSRGITYYVVSRVATQREACGKPEALLTPGKKRSLFFCPTASFPPCVQPPRSTVPENRLHVCPKSDLGVGLGPSTHAPGRRAEDILLVTEPLLGWGHEASGIIVVTPHPLSEVPAFRRTFPG